MKNKNLLYQLGFDMYDANNDEQISDMDLFKVFRKFGDQNTLFQTAVQADILLMAKLIGWVNKQKSEEEGDHETGPLFIKKARKDNFRAMISRDKDYIMSK